LRLAAEAELEFLVQYLYAAFSLPASDWQGTLMVLAKEEMGHLLTLQNILVSLGQTPHLQAETTGEASAWFPFAAERQPWTPPVLERFLVAESPLDAQLPSGITAPHTTNHVGAIYATLYWLLLPTNDASGGPWTDFPADLFVTAGVGHLDANAVTTGGNPVEAQEWGGDQVRGVVTGSGGAQLIVARVTNNADALSLVTRIAAQGEGSSASPPSAEPSHFARLLKMFAQSQEPGSPAFATNVISNPTLQAGAKGQLTNHAAVAWAELANLQYQLILLDVAQAYCFASTETLGGSVVRSEILLGSWIFDDMTSIRRIGTKLVGIPAGTAEGLMAGTPFTTPPTLLVATPAEGWSQLATVLKSAIAMAANLSANDPDAKEILDNNQAHLGWIVANGLV
jgi:hypothetical protein